MEQEVSGTGPQSPETHAVAQMAEGLAKASEGAQALAEAGSTSSDEQTGTEVEQPAQTKIGIGERSAIMKLARDLQQGAQALLGMIGKGNAPAIARRVPPPANRVGTTMKRTASAKSKGTAKRAAKSQRAAAKSSGGGRTAVMYVATGREPKHLTEATGQLYKLIKGRKGISAADLAAKTGISTGTVGWGLGKLQKQGAVKHA